MRLARARRASRPRSRARRPTRPSRAAGDAWPARLPALADDSTIRHGGVHGRNPGLQGDSAPPEPAPALVASRRPSTRPRSRRPRTTSRRCGVASGWCWPSPCPWPSLASILVLRLPPVYLAKAEIEINPPEIDPRALDARVARARPARSGEPGQLRPQPRSQARSKGLAEQVVERPEHRRRSRASTPTRLRALQVAHRRSRSRRTQHVHRHPRGQRPGPDQESCWKCCLSEFKEQAKRGERRQARRHRRATPSDNLTKLKNSLKQTSTTRSSTSSEEDPHDRAGRPEHPRRAIRESGIDDVAEATATGRAPSADDRSPRCSPSSSSTPRPTAAQRGSRELEAGEAQVRDRSSRHAAAHDPQLQQRPRGQASRPSSSTASSTSSTS